MINVALRFLCAALLALGLAAAPPPAAAANAMLELLKVLRDKGSITAEEYALLEKTALAEARQQAGDQAPAVAAAPAPAPAAPPVAVATRGKLEFGDKKHRFRIGGRAQHDVTLVDNDGEPVGASSHRMRRARLYLSGVSWEHWDWKFQFDLADADNANPSIEDAYIRYRGWSPAAVTVGQRKAPFSLSALTSSKYLTFLERATPTALFSSEAVGIGGRAPGLTLERAGDNYTLAGGFYLMRQRGAAKRSGEFVDSGGDTVAVELGTDSVSNRDLDDGWGFTARAAWLPLRPAENRWLHTGVSLGYKHYANETVQRLRARPNVSTGDRMADSDGAIQADDFLGLGLEAAAAWDSLGAVAEYYYGDFSGTPGAGASSLEGFYVQGNYFLTGESRRYRRGVFSSVTVDKPLGGGGWGAWELGLRYDHARMGGAVGGDAGESLTAALNWYVNNNMMFRLNYIKTFCAERGGDSCDWGAAAGDPGYLSFRTQVFF